MKYRQLGDTGIRVSEIGFGAWALGGKQWGGQEDKDSVSALNKALDLGCNFFDTALAYGEGRSERVVGSALKERKVLDDVIIATKVPPKNSRWSPPSGEPIKEAFPPDWIIGCCNKSLENLGRDYIDLLQLHTWSESWDDETEWYNTLLKLKEEDKIRAFGISVRAANPNEANRHILDGRVDTIQVVYNIFDQSPEKNLFPLAKRKNIGIIAREPLAAGGLTGKFTKTTRFPKGDWRGDNRNKEWLKKMVEQAELVREAISGSMQMYEAAIGFCLSNKTTSTTIVGTRNARQAELNFSVSEGKRLDKEQLGKLRRLWTSGKVGKLEFA